MEGFEGNVRLIGMTKGATKAQTSVVSKWVGKASAVLWDGDVLKVGSYSAAIAGASKTTKLLPYCTPTADPLYCNKGSNLVADLPCAGCFKISPQEFKTAARWLDGVFGSPKWRTTFGSDAEYVTLCAATVFKFRELEGPKKVIWQLDEQRSPEQYSGWISLAEYKFAQTVEDLEYVVVGREGTILSQKDLEKYEWFDASFSDLGWCD